MSWARKHVVKLWTNLVATGKITFRNRFAPPEHFNCRCVAAPLVKAIK